MRFITLATLAASACLCLLIASAEQEVDLHPSATGLEVVDGLDEAVGADETARHHRQKRTLFLKKKLIGAGLLGFGLGIAKGYKAGYYSAPEVRHVYLSAPQPPAPSVKYVEYVERPVYVERIVERPVPVYKSAHTDFQPIRSPQDSSAPYGSW